MSKLPFQPIYTDRGGCFRFRENVAVQWLLANGNMDLSDLARANLPREDMEQFAQLIGYSVSGFGDLFYVNRDRADLAQAMAESPNETEATLRIQQLEEQVTATRQALKTLTPILFNIHPDDLEGEA